MTLRNAMTVDVEDYFQVQAFADCVPRGAWDMFERRVEGNTDRMLGQFARAGVSATFFTLGWVAERHPTLIRRIVAAGHELASHGYGHMRADTQAPAAFAEDVRRAKRILEDVGGAPVTGYRAPTFSIGPRNPWAFEVLEREGYRYSSSTYPVRHDLYGDPSASRHPFQPAGGQLWEIPMTTTRLLGQNLPCAGGGYFRLLPVRFVPARAGPREPRRAHARPLLHPSLGDRSGAAAHRGREKHRTIPPSRQSVADRATARRPAARVRVGPDGPRVRGPADRTAFRAARGLSGRPWPSSSPS